MDKGSEVNSKEILQSLMEKYVKTCKQISEESDIQCTGPDPSEDLDGYERWHEEIGKESFKRLIDLTNKLTEVLKEMIKVEIDIRKSN